MILLSLNLGVVPLSIAIDIDIANDIATTITIAIVIMILIAIAIVILKTKITKKCSSLLEDSFEKYGSLTKFDYHVSFNVPYESYMKVFPRKNQK